MTAQRISTTPLPPVSGGGSSSSSSSNGSAPPSGSESGRDAAPAPTPGSSGGEGGSYLAQARALTVALGAVGTTATAAAAQVRKATDDMKRNTDETGQRLKRALGDLESYISKGAGPFKEELELQIKLLETGGQRLDEFILKVGDWKVVTEDGVKTIRELLDKAGADVRGFADELEKLTEGIRKGTTTVGEGLAYLKDKGGILTAQFVALVEALQRGEVSIDRVKAAIKQLEQIAGPDSPLIQTAQAITNALDNGRY